MIKITFYFSFLKKLLFIVLIGVFVYVGQALFLEKEYSLNEILPANSVLQQLPQFGRKQDVDYTSFLTDIERRGIFVVPEIEEKAPELQIDREKLSKIIADLRLAGIIAGENRRAVIEDKRQNNTFSLREGESFLDEIKVLKIGNDSVVLELQGEKFELFL